MEETCSVVSKSLIKVQKEVIEHEQDFCLGLIGWCPCSECSTRDKKCLRLKRKRPRFCESENAFVDNSAEEPVASSIQNFVEELSQPSENTDQIDLNVASSVGNIAGEHREVSDNTERFDFNITSDDLSKYMEGETPANTEKSTLWAVKNFNDWRLSRNSIMHNDKCPESIFLDGDKIELCKWLCKFVAETRKSDGSEYTPRSLYLILSGLQRHMRKLRPLEEINIFQDVHFKPLKNVCDSIFKRLHQKGIGADIKRTAVLSQEQENQFWEKRIFDLNTPIGLLRAIFFYNGKNFCLRGGQEQRNLKLSQFKRQTTVINGKELASYTYTEFGSKNRQGGLGSSIKIIKLFSNMKAAILRDAM